MTSFILTGCQVLTMNARRDEYPRGYIAVDGAQITEVGPGPVPERLAGARQIDAAGCLATITSTSGRPGAGRSTPPCSAG